MSYIRMPTLSPLRALSCAALLLLGAACSQASADDVGQAEGELGAREAGITKGSLEEEGVLLLINDRAFDATALERKVGIGPSVAWAIESFRTAPDGKARWFKTIDELDELPSTNLATFQKLITSARANGYVEAAGFDPPTSARLSVPDNLGRPPNSNDVTVEAGFDGKTPDEVLAIVRSRITNEIDPRNDRFVGDTLRTNHKAFTIAVGNLFAQGSPHAAFAARLGADRLTMLGTMSSVTPTILMAEKAGTTTYYARGAQGYAPIDTPRYAVVMRARIRLGAEGQGVRLFYPAWSASALSGPTAVIIESGQR